jgi:hypothetical protein
MTAAQHEARIDLAWCHLITCATQTGRITFCHAFLQAIKERNAERTPEQVAELERQKGLRA